jgi:hypothetical protein
VTSGIEEFAALPAADGEPLRLPAPATAAFALDFARAIDGGDGVLAIASAGGAPIVRSLRVWRDEAALPPPSAVEVAPARLRFTWETAAEILELSIAPADEGPALDFVMSATALAPVRVWREALTLDMAPAPRWLSRVNGAPVDPARNETVWLGKGIAVFGAGPASAGVFGPTDASSLQVDSAANRLWINFDFAGDHPHVLPSETANWQDASALVHAAGSRRVRRCRVEFGTGGLPFPRPMAAPDGAQAVFVWTEHACHCDLRTHRAVYFGDERIADSAAATGGFVKHRIPATKSVFFANTTREKNWVREAAIDGPMVSIEGDPDFLAFLRDLHRLGIYEIVPHGIQPTTSHRDVFEAGAGFMRGEFGAASWIDHSTFRRAWISGGRDSYLAFGAVAGGPDYRGDVWRAFGYKYFWNHALEFLERIPRSDAAPAGAAARRAPLAARTKHAIKRVLVRVVPGLARAVSRLLKFDGKPDAALDQLSVPAAWPFPLWWENPSATGDFVNWSTRSTPAASFRPGDGDAMRRRLDGLVAVWGVDMHHSYPTRVEERNATWTRDREGRFVVDPEFDAVLAHMAALRDSGLLHVGTVARVVPHWLAVDKLRLVRLSGDALAIENRGDTAVRGATFAVRGPVPLVDGDPPRHRRAGLDTIFWFDVPAGARKILTFAAASNRAGERCERW